MNVCRHRLRSDLARAWGDKTAQGACELHCDQPPDSPPEKHPSPHRNLRATVSSGCKRTISNSNASPETRGASPLSLSDAPPAFAWLVLAQLLNQADNRL
jgi:hypothetical protein